MEENIEDTVEKKVARKNSGKSFKSRAHGKAEKRKQRKAWLKRKRERVLQRQSEVEPAAVEEESVMPKTVVEDKREDVELLSRGKKCVELSRKRANRERMKPLVNASKRAKTSHVQAVVNQHKAQDLSHLPSQCNPNSRKFKELNRELLAVDETESIGSGTFGKCFPAVYRRDFRVIVKQIKMKETTREGIERAKREVLHEATVLSELGDHPGLPHLFGVCSQQAPHYLVLQHHAVEGQSMTLSKAVANGVIANDSECVTILRETGEILLFLHTKGFLHNDLKGNNVVLDGANHKPVVIDFGKSRKISKARFLKPKVNIKEACKRYPHIAPELHRGDRQTKASDVYSFGAIIERVLKDGKFNIPALKRIAKKCLSATPGKRPELEDALKEMGR